jgi:hypothetical protein
MGDSIFQINKDGVIIRSSEKNEKFVFISHDARDCKLAKLFCKLVEGASQELIRTFCSSRDGDLKCGQEWYNGIMNNIGKSNAIVCLLTKNSVRKPWILFEAGLSKGKFPERYIRGLSIDIKVKQNNPFNNFQIYNCEKERVMKLMEELISELTDYKITNKDVVKIIEKHTNQFLRNVEQEKQKSRTNAKS